MPKAPNYVKLENCKKKKKNARRNTSALPCVWFSFCILTRRGSAVDLIRPDCPEGKPTCPQLQSRPAGGLNLGSNLSSEEIIQSFLWHGTLWPARNRDENNLPLSSHPHPEKQQQRFRLQQIPYPCLLLKQDVSSGRQRPDNQTCPRDSPYLVWFPDEFMLIGVRGAT